MRDKNTLYESEIEQTGAQQVQYCSKCGSPVVVAQGAMERHLRRIIHLPVKGSANGK